MDPKDFFTHLNNRVFTSKEFHRHIARLGVHYGDAIASDATGSDLIEFLLERHWLRYAGNDCVEVCIPQSA